MNLYKIKLLAFISLGFLTACGGSSDVSSPSSFTTQFSLLPDEIFQQPYFNGNPPCLSETVNGQSVYLTKLFSKSSIAISDSMYDSLDEIKTIYSDSGCTTTLYTIAYLRNLVSTTQSNSVSSTDISKFSLVGVQINVYEQSLVNSYNQDNYLGINWVVGNLVDVLDALDPQSNSVIYQSGTLTNFELRADPANKKVFINGIEYRWQ